MHYRARSYDPRTGRFVQRDPLLQNRVSKHYSYGSNAPNMHSDPTGLQDVVAPLPPGAGTKGSTYKESSKLSPEQSDKVKAALPAARDLAVRARKVLEKVKADVTKTDTAAYKQVVLWFGEITKKEEIDIIQNNYLKAEEILENRQGQKDWARIGRTGQAPDLADYGRYRYVNLSGASRAVTYGGSSTPWWYTILTSIFFDDGKHGHQGFWSREGILLHESFHAGLDWNDQGGKSDADPLQVRVDDAEALAAKAETRAKARVNPTNYQFFAEAVRVFSLDK